MREGGKISERQMSVLCFVALFSPLIRNVPRASVAAAGAGAWLCPLAALVPAVLVVSLLRKGLTLVPDGGMGQLLQLGYGRPLGRMLCGVEAVWIFAELSVCIRLYGERFLGSVYQDTSIVLFLVTLGGLTLWQSRKPLAAVARLAQLGFFPLTITVAVILLLGTGEMKAENWLPIGWDQTQGVLAGVPPVLSVFGLVMVGFFLAGELRREPHSHGAGWTVAYFTMAAGMGAVLLGVFGAGLCARLQLPLFTLAKELKVGSVLERLDAFVIALWVVSDLLLAMLLQRALCRVLADAVGIREERELAVPVLFAAVVGSVLCGSQEETVLRLAEEWLGTARFILIYGVPLVGCGLAFWRLQKKKKKIEKGG